jgi:hypothetical protein
VAINTARNTVTLFLARGFVDGKPIVVIANGRQTGSNVQGPAYLALKTPLGDDATVANDAHIGSPFNVLSLAPDIANPYAENGY